MTTADLAGLLAQRSCSDRVALIEASTGEGVTWWEVADQAGRWEGSGLKGPVGLALADPVAMACNFVAAIRAGVVVAPLDPHAPVGDLAARVEQLGLTALVTGTGQGGGLRVPVWRAGRRDLIPAEPGRSEAGPALPPVPENVAAIMASSGTTGAPKIIPLTEQQLLATAQAVAADLELTASDRGFSPLPLFHINGLVVGVLAALAAGSSLVVERQFSRRRFWATVEKHRVTWLNLVPAILTILAPDEADTPPISDEALGRIRLARSASAPLPDAVRRRFERCTGIPVIETYGMTEAASQITANPLSAPRPGSVGRPSGIELDVDHSGQVRIRGDRVTSWYWGAPDRPGGQWTWRPATEEDGWLRTGDLGRDEEGYIYLVGREGDVINRGGEKVQPREVEEILLSDGRVAAAVVVGRPHPTSGEEPVAFVLPAPGDTDPVALASDLEKLCAERLSRFKRPALIEVADRLPSGPTGKVRRAELKALAASRPDPQQ